MGMGNPRGGADQETLRVQEFMGGHRPREMLGDYDVNPNENADGLSHHNREGTASAETREQLDPKKRKDRALRELECELPHISIKPEEIGEQLERNPMHEQTSQLLESGLGIDMGHASSGIGISQGANVGPVRREGPGLIFGRSKEAFEDAWSVMKNGMSGSDDFPIDDAKKIATDRAASIAQGFHDSHPGVGGQSWIGASVDRSDPKVTAIDAEMVATDTSEIQNYFEQHGELPSQEYLERRMAEEVQPIKNINFDDMTPFVPTPTHTPTRGAGMGYPMDDERYSDDLSEETNSLHPRVGQFSLTPEMSSHWQQKLASSDTVFLSDIVKGKRKKRGRKYEEDEDGEKEEKKSKSNRKRKRKREMKRGKKEASRDIKGKTKRRAGNVEQNISRPPREQAFSPRRMLGGNPRASGVPLRIRDPVAYQRKLASEKFRRQMGALPRGHSAHADTRGIGGKVQTIGMEGKGTKLPVPSQYGQGGKGTSLSPFKAKRGGPASELAGDPLGGDPLMAKGVLKRATMQISARDIKGFNRSELLEMKRDLKKLITAIENMSKSTPELSSEAKRGSQPSLERATDPQGGTENAEAEHPMIRYVDVSRGANGHLVGAK